VHRKVIAGGRLVCQWVDQLCRLGRAAPGEHRQSRVARGGVGTVVTPVLEGDLEAAQSRFGCLVEPARLQQDVALVAGDAQKRLAVAGCFGQLARPSKDRETLGDLAPQERVVREARLNLGGDAGGTRRLGNVQAAGEGRPPRVPVALGLKERLAVIQPGAGMVSRRG
jgi:hypothetical protein